MSHRLHHARALLARFLAFSAVVAVSVAPSLSFAQAPQKVDVTKSYIRFVNKQMNVPVEGRFRRFDASVAYDAARPEATKAQFEVDLASIDLGSGEAETEIRRPLWFDVERHPRARFVLTSLKPAGAPGKYDASGSLTIKGVTRPVTAPVTLSEAGGLRFVEGQFALRRLEFRVGEGHWADLDTVADEVLVRFRFAIPANR